MCPYHKYELKTVQGWQAWDLIQRCSGQLRTAGMGGVIGFDLPAFLQTADVLHYDKETLLILLPFAESAMVEAYAKKVRNNADTEPVDSFKR